MTSTACVNMATRWSTYVQCSWRTALLRQTTRLNRRSPFQDLSRFLLAIEARQTPRHEQKHRSRAEKTATLIEAILQRISALKFHEIRTHSSLATRKRWLSEAPTDKELSSVSGTLCPNKNNRIWNRREISSNCLGRTHVLETLRSKLSRGGQAYSLVENLRVTNYLHFAAYAFSTPRFDVGAGLRGNFSVCLMINAYRVRFVLRRKKSATNCQAKRDCDRIACRNKMTCCCVSHANTMCSQERPWIATCLAGSWFTANAVARDTRLWDWSILKRTNFGGEIGRSCIKQP